MRGFGVLLLLFVLVSCEEKWGYGLGNGPEVWGIGSRKDRFCLIGRNQSPIDVRYGFSDNELGFFYEDSEFEKVDDLYEVKFLVHDRTFIKRGRKQYFVRYFKFRHPSEHLVDSNPYSVELQIMHKSDDEQFLAFSLFLEVGEDESDNESLRQILQFLELGDREANINLAYLLKSDSRNFYYDGSFTSPPCKEGVKWYVFEKPIMVSKKQMGLIIKKAIFAKSNARNVQEYHPNKY